MFKRREKIKERLLGVVDKFRQKGAVSPDNAMTIEELGLPSKFKELMKGRLRKLGVFVEVDGKYYLSEERLKKVKEQLASRRRFRTVKEREVIREKEIIVKVRCRYCGTLNLETDNKCSNCGAAL